jgi:hypothetical protein
MPAVTLFSLPPEMNEPTPAPVAASQADRMRDLAERMAPTHVLRHTGQRPFTFKGEILATVSGINQVLPYWYEINVYRTVPGAYVSDIRLFGKAVDSADLFRVAEHGDVEALQDYLEGYDPCCDLPPARPFDAASMSSAALTLRALELQAEMRLITDHYRATVGALLNAVPD